jgi:hypothetical protein
VFLTVLVVLAERPAQPQQPLAHKLYQAASWILMWPFVKLASCLFGTIVENVEH